MALDESKLRKAALLTIPVVGLFACLALASIAFWFLQGREFWATASRTAQSVDQDVHAAIAPVPGAISQLGNAAGSLSSGAAAVKSLVGAATPVVANLTHTEAKLNDGIDLTFHRLDDGCPTPSQITPQWQRCGTLADVDQTLGAGRTVMERVGLGVDRFDKHEDALFAQEADFYATAEDSAKRFDALVSSPDILPLIHNLQVGTATGDHMLDTADKVESKLAQCTLHPTFRCGFKSDAIFGAQVGGYILSGLH